MTKRRIERLDHPKKEPDKAIYNYFVLDPDETRKQTEILKPPKQHPESEMSGLDPSVTPTAETLGNPNYFVLEPQSAAPDLNKHGEAVQSLPDEQRYNFCLITNIM